MQRSACGRGLESEPGDSLDTLRGAIAGISEIETTDDSIIPIAPVLGERTAEGSIPAATETAQQEAIDTGPCLALTGEGWTPIIRQCSWSLLVIAIGSQQEDEASTGVASTRIATVMATNLEPFVMVRL